MLLLSFTWWKMRKIMVLNNTLSSGRERETNYSSIVNFPSAIAPNESVTRIGMKNTTANIKFAETVMITLQALTMAGGLIITHTL